MGQLVQWRKVGDWVSRSEQSQQVWGQILSHLLAVTAQNYDDLVVGYFNKECTFDVSLKCSVV